MGDTILKKDKDRAVELDKELKERKAYVETGTFVEDEIAKIQVFFDSPYLGNSMRSKLIEVDTELKTKPEDRKAREIIAVDKSILKNNKDLAKEVE